MSVIEAEIEVDVPLRAAYDQWTQFEEFPAFMEGVDEVRQVDATRLHWVASIAGVRREWDARITEQLPDQMVAWTSTGGTRNDGLVTFAALGAHRTRVMLRLDLEPEGALETVGDALGVVRARARTDLHRFKDFIESRLLPTGAWRGEVARGEVIADDATPARPSADGTGTGEVDASTGGVVDLDRLVGNIPVVLVFADPLGSAATRSVLASLGRHLADFGRERIQVLMVARVDAETAGAEADSVEGNARVLADPDGELAARFGVQFLPDQLVTVVVRADGRRGDTWVDQPGSEFVLQLARRLDEHTSSGAQVVR